EGRVRPVEWRTVGRVLGIPSVQQEVVAAADTCSALATGCPRTPLGQCGCAVHLHAVLNHRSLGRTIELDETGQARVPELQVGPQTAHQAETRLLNAVLNMGMNDQPILAVSGERTTPRPFSRKKRWLLLMVLVLMPYVIVETFASSYGWFAGWG